MNPQEPVVPDPGDPNQDPAGPVSDPSTPDQPAEYDAYDEAVAESFPASDPPAASEPGAP
ncbi:MAG TPA: hypothetical protein VK669_02970 [Candidatus Limnocylindrales bacterium]|nr:hypothetical protein [Candidatus Limnocylindrales bacterium]